MAVGLRSQASVFLVDTGQMKPRLCVLAPFSNKYIVEDTSNGNDRGVFPHLFLTGETAFLYSAPECKKTMCLNKGNKYIRESSFKRPSVAGHSFNANDCKLY